MSSASADGRVRILHLEDDDMDAELIEATLGAGLDCEVRRVITRAEFAEALESGGFDVILADYALPAFSGPAALAAARARRPELPFIFLSGTLGDERAVDTLKAGATDYVLKDHLSRLVPVVRRALDEASERSARRQAEQALASSQRFLQRVIDATPHVVFVFDVPDRRVRRSRRWSPPCSARSPTPRTRGAFRTWSPGSPPPATTR